MNSSLEINADDDAIPHVENLSTRNKKKRQISSGDDPVGYNTNEIDTKAPEVIENNGHPENITQATPTDLQENNAPSTISMESNRHCPAHQDKEEQSVITPCYPIITHPLPNQSDQRPALIDTPPYGSSLSEADGGKISLLRALICVPCNMMIRLWSLVASMVLALTEFSFGVKNFNDCPVDRRIPIYLIVSGATIFFFIVIFILLVSIPLHKSFFLFFSFLFFSPDSYGMWA